MLVESVHAKFNHVIITALGLLEEWRIGVACCCIFTLSS